MSPYKEKIFSFLFFVFDLTTHSYYLFPYTSSSLPQSSKNKTKQKQKQKKKQKNKKNDSLERIGNVGKLIFLIYDYLFRIFYFKTSGDRMASNSTSWGLELHVWPLNSVLFACFYRFTFKTYEWMFVCLSGCIYVSATQACSAFNSL